ncbi:dephospho-CoA kinase [Anaerobacillus sp. MEB173]|uniref:dephospho-CoA kinase n=1 Tax=Anaerobacillus sp. MEB173 TaxID=3383345 RepID=UPI003F8E0B5B
MTIIGLTGGIASGKSTVSNMIIDLEIPLVDADQVARDVVMPGEPAYNEIVSHFGDHILEEDGTINRKKLGEVIFNNKEQREVLNKIVHPAVRSEMRAQTEAYQQEGHKTIVLDIPLLFESKLTYLVEKTILVYVDEEVQLKRLMERDQSSEQEAQSRISSQLPLKEKISLADEVINNNGTIEETKNQLRTILKKWNVI